MSSNDTNTLDFQDLVILKQFLEKGFRENLFSQQEIHGAKHEHSKLVKIISDVLEKHKSTAVKAD